MSYPSLLIIVLLIISLFCQIIVYGGSPLISIILNPSQISNINTKATDFPGLLGLVLAKQLILFVIITTAHKKISLLTIIFAIFAFTFNAKRQAFMMLLIALSSRRVMSKKKIIAIAVFAFLAFSLIGLVRGSRIYLNLFYFTCLFLQLIFRMQSKNLMIT